MLKRSMIAASLALATMLPASAEFAFDKLEGVTTGQDIKITMAAHNPGDTNQQGPILLHLMVRGQPTGQWVEVNTWNIENLRAGEGLTKEYTIQGAAAAARKSGDYEAKIVVELPGEEKWDEDANMIITKQ